MLSNDTFLTNFTIGCAASLTSYGVKRLIDIATHKKVSPSVSSSAQVVLSGGLVFALNNYFKNKLLSRYPEGSSNEVAINFVAGGLGGFINSLFYLPLHSFNLTRTTLDLISTSIRQSISFGVYESTKDVLAKEMGDDTFTRVLAYSVSSFGSVMLANITQISLIRFRLIEWKEVTQLPMASIFGVLSKLLFDLFKSSLKTQQTIKVENIKQVMTQ